VETHETEKVICRPTGVPMIVDAEPISEGDAPTAGPPISVIINSDDQLIAEGEAAAERYHKSREQVLPMARGLLAAKRKYPATQEFGEWLQNSPYSMFGKNDRSALISIGEQLDEHEDAVVEFLARTNLGSPQLIWIELKKKLQPALSIDSSYYDSNSGLASTDANQLDSEKPTEPEPGDAKPDIDPPPMDAIQPFTREASADSHKLYGSNKRFDLVVLTPSKDDLARLRQANLDALSECLPLRKHVEEVAAVVIAAKVTDLPIVIDRLLPLCGFNRPRRILLRHQPASPDVIDAKVLVSAERGDVAFREPTEVWLEDTAHPIDVAEELYDASSTLHLFATAETKKAADESRCVIVGNDSWKKWPVL
jgi:hypothetical protein